MESILNEVSQKYEDDHSDLFILDKFGKEKLILVSLKKRITEEVPFYSYSHCRLDGSSLKIFGNFTWNLDLTCPLGETVQKCKNSDKIINSFLNKCHQLEILFPYGSYPIVIHKKAVIGELPFQFGTTSSKGLKTGKTIFMYSSRSDQLICYKYSEAILSDNLIPSKNNETHGMKLFPLYDHKVIEDYRNRNKKSVIFDEKKKISDFMIDPDSEDVIVLTVQGGLFLLKKDGKNGTYEKYISSDKLAFVSIVLPSKCILSLTIAQNFTDKVHHVDKYWSICSLGIEGSSKESHLDTLNSKGSLYLVSGQFEKLGANCFILLDGTFNHLDICLIDKSQWGIRDMVHLMTKNNNGYVLAFSNDTTMNILIVEKVENPKPSVAQSNIDINHRPESSGIQGKCDRKRSQCGPFHVR